MTLYPLPGPAASQKEAREMAAYWNERHPDDLKVAVASQDPPGSWGGDCDGWTIVYLLRSPLGPVASPDVI